jgi:hypothetical protein
MAWTTDVNIYLDGADGWAVSRQFLVLLDKKLVESAGWLRIGTSNGTSYNWGPEKLLPDFSTITGVGNGAWGCWKNSKGAYLVVALSGTGSATMNIWWSPKEGYTRSGVTATSAPGDATSASDQVDMKSDDMGSGGGFYLSFAYDDDRSFILFGVDSGVPTYAFSFLTLDNVHPDDLYPFWCYFNSAANAWDKTFLSDDISSRVLGYHPNGFISVYHFAKLVWMATYTIDNLPADPVTGNQVMLECFILRRGGNSHVRGTAPGIYRVSSLLNIGDHLDSYNYIVMGDYALPWDGTSTAIS